MVGQAGCASGLDCQWCWFVCSLSDNSKLQQLMAKQSESEFRKTVQTVMHHCNAAGCKVLK